MNHEHISTRPLFNPKPHLVRNFSVRFFNYTIDVTVTSTPSVVRQWLRKALHRFRHIVRDRRLVVGLGVQWKPSSSSAATLQLCMGQLCLVFQLYHAPRVPLFLRRFLADPDHTFVGVWNYKDQSMLKSSKHNLDVPSLVDIRDIVEAKKGWSRQASMETLAEDLLGFKYVMKPASIGMSDWKAYWLDEDQVQYASVDAFLSFRMGKALQVWNWNS